MILDGTVILADRCREKTLSVHAEVIDLWYSGKAYSHGGNIQAVLAPDGLTLWISEAERADAAGQQVAPVPRATAPDLLRRALAALPGRAQAEFTGPVPANRVTAITRAHGAPPAIRNPPPVRRGKRAEVPLAGWKARHAPCLLSAGTTAPAPGPPPEPPRPIT